MRDETKLKECLEGNLIFGDVREVCRLLREKCLRLQEEATSWQRIAEKLQEVIGSTSEPQQSVIDRIKSIEQRLYAIERLVQAIPPSIYPTNPYPSILNPVIPPPSCGEEPWVTCYGQESDSQVYKCNSKVGE